MLTSDWSVFMYHFGYRGKHSLAHVKPNTYPPELHTPSHHYGVRCLSVKLRKLKHNLFLLRLATVMI